MRYQDNLDNGPWYKQFWPWFILTPLFVVMIAGFSMLYIAIVTSDGVVVDNYYEDGKGIVQRTAEDEFARNQNLRATLTWEDAIRVDLQGDLRPLPEQLELMIIFPTSKAYDHYVVLSHEGLGRYRGDLDEPIEGRRQLQLHPINAEIDWRLHFDGAINSSSEESYTLLPRAE